MAHADIRVELVWSPQAGEVLQTWLELAPNSTVEAALHAWPAFAGTLPHLSELTIGVWGRVRPLSYVLRERDRVEVYRPLTVDPKEARRLRYRKRGQRIVSRHRPLAGKTG